MSMALTSFDELELRVFGGEKGNYRVELLLPDGIRVSSKMRMPSWKSLLGADPREYGARLSKVVFQGDVRDAFWHAYSLTQIPTRSYAAVVGLRLRLWLDPNAPEIHALNWESLWDAEQGEPLSLNVAFSRYLRMSAPQQRNLGPRQARMLLIVCEPKEFGELSATIEKTLAAGLSRLWGERIKIQRLASDRPTLAQINSAGQERYDQIHLLARTLRQGDEPVWRVSDEHDGAAFTPAQQVGEAMLPLTYHAPFLVFISAPAENPAGNGRRDDRLGPLLVQGGAQAVVDLESAMPDQAVAHFTEIFYQELNRSGAIDLAVSRARRAVFAANPQSWDWTAPALYTRSQDIMVTQQIAESVEGTVVGLQIGNFGGSDIVVGQKIESVSTGGAVTGARLDNIDDQSAKAEGKHSLDATRGGQDAKSN